MQTISPNHSLGHICSSVLPIPRRSAYTTLPVSRSLDHPFATFDFESRPRDCFAVTFARSARHAAHFGPHPHQVLWQPCLLCLVKCSAPHVDTSNRFKVASLYRFVLYASTCTHRSFFGFGKQLRSHSIHFPIYWLFPSLTFVYLRHLFSLSQFDFRVVPLFPIVNSVMVATTLIPLNFRWFPPHLQFPVFVHEFQCATDGSPLVLRLLPTSRLKKNSWHIFPSTYAWTDLHNVSIHVYRNETVFASALHKCNLHEVLDYMSMKLC